jgi:hypothetical protein
MDGLGADEWGIVWNYAAAMLLALAGRGVALGTQRPPVSWSMLWEIPQAIGTGVIGLGLAQWMGLHGHLAAGMIAGLAYIGPAQLIPLAQVMIRRAGR